MVKRVYAAFIVCPKCKSTEIRTEIEFIRIVYLKDGYRVKKQCCTLKQDSRKTICNSCGYEDRSAKSAV